MSDIFREVDEEVRKERFESLAKKHGPWIGGLIVGGLLALGGWQLWQDWQQDRRLQLAATYGSAVEEARTGDAVAALGRLEAMTDGSRASYGLLASFQAARLRAEAGDLDGALTQWDRLATDGDVPESWRSVARLLAAQHAVGARPRDEVVERLAPLLEEGSVYRPLALETAAMADLAAGDVAAARERLQTLTSLTDAPPQMLQRAAQLLETIGA